MQNRGPPTVHKPLEKAAGGALALTSAPAISPTTPGSWPGRAAVGRQARNRFHRHRRLASVSIDLCNRTES
ncbi:hypothetical protein U9M48_004950 [Paspalum notatum var. saurae]|uniref:Uncharacterized protein n=1 Tax=Paspalum notatum var. saurae TaxID=547442 RepID=A0AAQ3SL64_PASNO